MARIVCLFGNSDFAEACCAWVRAKNGCDTIAAEGDGDAWERLHAEPVDLLIQDFQKSRCPGGWTFLRLMRTDPAVRHIPVVALDTYVRERNERADELRAVGLDMDTDLAAYVRWLPDIRELPGTIERILASTHPRSEAWPYWRGLYERPIEACITALEDADRTVRHEAASVLGWSFEGRAVEPLIRALGDEDAHVRVAAVNGLGLLGDERAVAPLVKALADRQCDVRWSAVLALGMLPDRRAVEPLGHVLHDQSWDKRHVAAIALAAVERARSRGLLATSEGAVELLTAARQDEDQSVAWSANYALEWLTRDVFHNPNYLGPQDMLVGRHFSRPARRARAALRAERARI